MIGPKDVRIPEICEDPACHAPVDPRTTCCMRCGVSHSEPCPDCGRFGFHREDCPEMQRPAAAPDGPMVHPEVCSDCQILMKVGTPGAETTHSICRLCWPKYMGDEPYPEAA